MGEGEDARETAVAGMEVELHYTPNPFTLKFNHDLLTTVLNPQQSMDTLLKQDSRESIRNTMLKQDEIFKLQIRELHRLYIIQKMLMAELRTASTSETSHSSNMSSRLRSKDPIRIRKGFNLEFLSDKDQKHSKEAIRIDDLDSWVSRESDIELTLSIGCSSDHKKSKPGIGTRSDLLALKERACRGLIGFCKNRV